MNIWDAFEVPTLEDQRNLPQIESLHKLGIAESELGLNPTTFNLDHPRLSELIREHNNKVGNLIMTYTLAYHYFSAGIPDDRWYQSPGEKGQSVQYMPDFSEEHWGRNIWFGYFSNVYYMTISSIWDSVLEIINHYYDYNLPVDMRLRSSILKKLKMEHPKISEIFASLQKNELYSQAQKYRTSAAHGSAPNSVKDTVKYEKNVMLTFPVLDDNGMPVLDSEGKPMTEQKKVRRISWGIGKYTPTKVIFQNMQAYAKLSAEKIHEILNLMHETPVENG